MCLLGPSFALSLRRRAERTSRPAALLWHSGEPTHLWLRWRVVHASQRPCAPACLPLECVCVFPMSGQQAVGHMFARASQCAVCCGWVVCLPRARVIVRSSGTSYERAVGARRPLAAWRRSVCNALSVPRASIPALRRATVPLSSALRPTPTPSRALLARVADAGRVARMPCHPVPLSRTW